MTMICYNIYDNSVDCNVYDRLDRLQLKCMILANYRYPLETDCIELHRLRAIIGVAINS